MPRYSGVRGGSWFRDGPRSSASLAAAGRTAGGGAKAITSGPEGELAAGSDGAAGPGVGGALLSSQHESVLTEGACASRAERVGHLSGVTT